MIEHFCIIWAGRPSIAKKLQPLGREAVCFATMVLPSDQGEYCDAKCQEANQKAWNCRHKVRQTKQEKEQNHTPGSDRIRRSHFHSPFYKVASLREPAN